MPPPIPRTAADPLVELDEIACRVGLFLAAAGATGVARSPAAPRHRPIAGLLGALFVADCARGAWWGALDRAPVPYAGALRALFHLDFALLLLFPAGAATGACWALLGARWPWRLAVGIFGAAALAQVVSYPEIRGRAAMDAALFSVHVGAILIGLLAATWALGRRGWRGWRGPTAGAALILLLGEVAGLAGPFLRARPIEDWLSVRWQSAAIWWILAAWHGRVLWSTPARTSPGSPSRSGLSASSSEEPR